MIYAILVLVLIVLTIKIRGIFRMSPEEISRCEMETLKALDEMQVKRTLKEQEKRRCKVK